MAREIKFRAWHKKLKKMLFVTDISGVVDLQKDSTEIYEISCAERNNDGWVNGGSHEIDDVELLQYIGRKDVNGKKIYNNFIVQCDLGVKYKVIFSNEWCAAMLIENKTGRQVIIYPEMKLEVIGNIHENPELI